MNYLGSSIIQNLTIKQRSLIEESSGDASDGNRDQGGEIEESNENYDALYMLFDNQPTGPEAPTEERKVENITEDQKTYSFFTARLILDLLERLRAKSIYVGDKTSRVGLSYSSAFRLSSFALSKQVGRDFSDLAKHGIYSAYSSLSNLEHYLHPGKPVSGLDAAEY